MLICHYKDGRWLTPKIEPYGPIKMFPGTQVLHYGQSVFEGMKAFKNNNDEILLFRKEENFKRLNQSAVRLSIPEIPEDIFMSGLTELLKLDAEWCKADDGYSLYVRPFIFGSAEWIKASSSDEFTFMIITSPTINYYPGSIDLVIEQHFSRAAAGGVGYAKAAGNYAGSFYPTKQANARGFTQVIWTDSKEHKYIEESGTMNIWFRINDKLITPSLSDSILGGITRDSILKLALDLGIEVEERNVTVAEILAASKDGTLQEAFGTGTAVTVVAVQSITLEDIKMNIPTQQNPISMQLKQQLQDLQYGRSKDVFNWISKVNSSITTF
jgi:branched-chain amino acid aminotransferase